MVSEIVVVYLLRLLHRTKRRSSGNASGLAGRKGGRNAFSLGTSALMPVLCVLAKQPTGTTRTAASVCTVEQWVGGLNQLLALTAAKFSESR